MNRIKKYWKIWYLMTVGSFAAMSVSRMGGMLFVFGKILRFSFFLFFLLMLTGQTKALAGYSVYEVMLFYLTFNIVDTVSQLFFREVYRFRQLVITGNFDMVLIKPINPLFRSLLGGADPFDVVTLIPLFIFTGWVISQLNPTPLGIGMYLLLLLSGLFVAASFHIFVLALGILTTEIDHAVMIYRDMTSTGRVPIDIYREPIRSILTFVVPIGVMMTFPVKALLGTLGIWSIICSFIIAILFVWVSIQFWRYSLRYYSSASS